jgi:hypothetical protein
MSNHNELISAMQELGKMVDDGLEKFDNETTAWWDSLSYEDRIKAFYIVTKKIHEGDIKIRGSYRKVLYEIFDFKPDVYMIGMKSGYMDIHNSIIPPEELKSIREQAVKEYIESQANKGKNIHEK